MARITTMPGGIVANTLRLNTNMLKDVITGLIAAAIGAFLAFLWKEHIHPAIIQGFFERTKLAGEFRGVIDLGTTHNDHISLRIKKAGYRIRGEVAFIEENRTPKFYPIIGRYFNSLLSFYYFSSDNASTSQGCASFKRLQDGKLLRGHFVYYDLVTETLKTVHCDLNPHS
jgi:hypothetical protein